METITITSRSGKMIRIFDRIKWEQALARAERAVRGSGQTVEDKAVELLCTATSLRADRLKRLQDLIPPSAEEVRRQARECSYWHYVHEYLHEHSRYADTGMRALTGRIMSAGQERELGEAQAHARTRYLPGKSRAISISTY